jgi:hypothetical protein
VAYTHNKHVASAARTTSGNSTAIGPLDPFRSVVALLNVTAVSGTTPSMTATLEGSVDGTVFFTLATGIALTAVNKQVLTMVDTAVPPYLRVAWAITGTTPSFTFTVDLTIY